MSKKQNVAHRPAPRRRPRLTPRIAEAIQLAADLMDLQERAIYVLGRDVDMADLLADSGPEATAIRKIGDGVRAIWDFALSEAYDAQAVAGRASG